MNSTNSRYMAALVFVLTAMFFAVLVGCSDSIFTENSSGTKEINQVEIPEHDGAKELWIISSHPGTRSYLTIEQIKEIIEANRGLYTTAEGEIVGELLKRFIIDYFDSVEIINDDDEIDMLFGKIQLCCVYNPQTKCFEIHIIVKNH